MLRKINKIKKSRWVTLKPFSLIIFFYFTNNDWNATEKLMPFFQRYNFTLERLKGKGNNPFTKNLPVFCKNANFIAWSDDSLSQKDCVLLSQSLLSQVNVLAFCYHGHLWTPSRLKQAQKYFFVAPEKSHLNISPLTVFWKNFYQYSF